MQPLFPPVPPGPRSQHPHLELRRTAPVEPRWKPRPPRAGPRDNREHGAALRVAAEEAIEDVRLAPRPEGVDPALILRVRTSAMIDENQWRLAGFSVLGIDPNKVVLLFSDDQQLSEFRRMVAEYESGLTRREGQKRPSQSWVEAIVPDGVAPLGPEDRIGSLLRQLRDSGGLDPDVPYRLDAELWRLGSLETARERLEQLLRVVERNGGRVLDRLVNHLVCMARIELPGRAVDELLSIPVLATLDLPPRASSRLADVFGTTLTDIPPPNAPAADAPRICVLDSGIARGHPLLAPAVGETRAVPASLGDGLDVSGHGSQVGGLALYHDVDACRITGTFNPEFWLDGAQVTNSADEFDDEKLLPSQMIEAIQYFAERGARASSTCHLEMRAGHMPMVM
jgi:hypothetical protein